MIATYRKGEVEVTLELKGDPVAVLNQVAKGLGLSIIDHDPAFDTAMRERAERARKAA